MATIRKRNELWQVQVRRKGAPQISKSFRLKSDAVAWARTMESAADRGALHSDPRVLEKTTLADLIERYRAHVTPSKRGAAREEDFFKVFTARPLTQRSLASLRPSDFAAYRDDRLQTITGSGLNRELAILHHLFEVARVEWGYPIPANPIALVKKPPNNPPRERRLRPGEYERLLAAADRGRNSYVKSIVVLAVETGMRRGEILAIKREDVNFERSFLRIPQTKTGRPRTIPVSPAAREILVTLSLAPISDVHRLIPISANAFRLAWEKLKRRAEINDLHFHDLRHEAVSRLFERGLGVAHVAAISGHRDFKMLARYTHLGYAECA